MSSRRIPPSIILSVLFGTRDFLRRGLLRFLDEAVCQNGRIAYDKKVQYACDIPTKGNTQLHNPIRKFLGVRCAKLMSFHFQ